MDALEAIDTNRDLSYSMFVYAIEALSQSAESFVPTWDDFPQNQRVPLDRELEAIDATVADNIRAILIDTPHLKLKKRFIGFVEGIIETSFFIDDASGRLMTLRQNELRRVLANLYDSRSGYVHALSPIQENLKLPGTTPLSDVFHWNNEPYLTFSGLARIVRHVLIRFAETQSFSEREEYPGWRMEIPGIIRVELAPELWVGRPETYAPSNAKERFSGLMQYLAQAFSKTPFTMPDMRGVMERIEIEIGQASNEDRRAMLGLYWLFNDLIEEKGKRPEWQRFLERFPAIAQECSVERPRSWTCPWHSSAMEGR